MALTVRSLDSEANAFRAVECAPHGHRLAVSRDLSLVLSLIVFQVFPHDPGVDSAVASTREFRIGVENNEQEPRDALHARLQGRLEVREVQYPAAAVEVEPQAGGGVSVVFAAAVG